MSADHETLDLEKLCIAFGWAYGTELERVNMHREPDDGLTPETLWEGCSEEERDFTRRVMRETFKAIGVTVTESASDAKA